MTDTLFLSIEKDSRYIGAYLAKEEMASLADANAIGEREIEVIAKVFSYLAARKREKTADVFLKLSCIPSRSPKTFEGFNFERLRGSGSEALSQLPTLSNLYAHRNHAFIGPEGVGKTHLAQAYGREVCKRGMKSYYIKASELQERLIHVTKSGNATASIRQLVSPNCLIIDEVGRCVFNRECTDLFFHIIDRRYDKQCPNLTILTSNYGPETWNEYFTGDTTLLCTLDRLFDNATVFMMKGQSFRGEGLEKFKVEAVPNVTKIDLA